MAQDLRHGGVGAFLHGGPAFGAVGLGATQIQENESVYTTVEEAKRFAELTGVDSLAVSIGTVHGVYKDLSTPQLNFQRRSFSALLR